MTKTFSKGDAVRTRDSPHMRGKVIHTQTDGSRKLVMVRFEGWKFSKFVEAHELEHDREEA